MQAKSKIVRVAAAVVVAVAVTVETITVEIQCEDIESGGDVYPEVFHKRRPGGKTPRDTPPPRRLRNLWILWSESEETCGGAMVVREARVEEEEEKEEKEECGGAGGMY
ncbi:hypothetical protein E2C01_039213 [Portunus trituberculatus]|uniref:Uncharacterized protein n=1 Tax=Portunus trituberculatus TaxID=210409 RepID=A0A5B7FK34_PORTR|nr:hypothetical protein [Portunus trituberculatus]